MATVAVLSSGRSWPAPAWMTVTLSRQHCEGSRPARGGQAPDQARDEWARLVLADRGTGPAQGTPAGGQYSRGSPLTAAPAWPVSPDGAPHTLTVFSLLPCCHRLAG